MRFVIFGAGAIGGVVGARLHESGNDVSLMARGAHYDAIRERGLTLEEPDGVSVHRIAAVKAPAELEWRGDEVVLLAAKSQDSAAALLALRAAAPPGATSVCCLQNGVENERLALRLFRRVYGAVVMVPTAHLEPGIVQAYGTNLTGVIDIGCYPDGIDERAAEICEALRGANFSSEVRSDVMRLKHAKLIANLANAVHAITDEESAACEQLIDRARAEGREVLSAAGIEFSALEVDDIRTRWQRLGVRDIAGRKRAGSSTWQSLTRGTGSVETDYLNGEIVLFGRLHGVPTPINALLQDLVDEMARSGRAPGWLSAQELLARVPQVSWTR